jgi:hypothetical protein
MILDEFLTHLRATPRRWSVDLGGVLRLDMQGYWHRYVRACPLTAVLYDHTGTAYAGQDAISAAVLHLNLLHSDARAITWAADNRGQHDAALRTALLAACEPRLPLALDDEEGEDADAD